MRFFLEFVACCGSPTWRESEPSVLPAEEEEDKWLVPAPSVSAVPSSRRVSRKRRTGSMDWRPSLGSISEDVVVTPPKKQMNGTAGRDGKKRTITGGAARVYRRSYSEGHHGPPMPMIMPAFSPTPFMF